MPFHHFHRLQIAVLLAAVSSLNMMLRVSPLEKSQQLPLSKSDRSAQEVNLGWIPPELSGAGLQWMGLEGEVPSWKDLRGQIIVLQSFRAPSPQMRKVRESIEALGTNDVLFLPVHTPDRAERFDQAKRSSAGLDGIPVLVDRHGELCDRFGFRRRHQRDCRSSWCASLGFGPKHWLTCCERWLRLTKRRHWFKA